jgi:hypothetical protein
MTIKNMIFGNPWHGRLGDGTIKIGTADPVNTITIDGADYPVKTVTGNLGDTRYYRSPDLMDPVTPQQVLDIDGEFKRDAIIYSDNFRYTPLNDSSILESAYNWLLWDGTAQAWRKMKIESTWQDLSANKEAASSDGSNCVQARIYRGDLFGVIDTDEADTPVGSPTWTLVESWMVPYKHTGNDIIPGLFGAYYPLSKQLAIDSRRDGRAILIKILSPRYWSDRRLSVYFGDPLASEMVDLDTVAVQDVWEVVMSSDGSSISSKTQVVPDQVTIDSPTFETRTISDGTPYWILDSGEWHYYVPVAVERKTDTGQFGYACASLIGAAYDKDGALHLSWVVASARSVDVREDSADAYIGYQSLTEEQDPADFVPDYTVGPYSWTPDGSFVGITPYIPFSLNQVFGDASYTRYPLVQVFDNGDMMHDWEEFPTSELAFDNITNNVVGVNDGSSSISRVAPGAVDTGVLTTPVYASFDHRTGAVVSSDEPVGFV